MPDQIVTPTVEPTATVTPAPAPASTPTSEGDDAPVSSDKTDDFDFAEFSSDFSEESGELEEPVAAEKAPKAPEPKAPAAAPASPAATKEPPTAPAAAKAAETPPATEQSVAAPKAGAPKTEVAPGAKEQPPVQSPQPTVEQRREQYSNWRKESETKLRGLYKLDPADAEKMLSNPEEVLPTLAARLHLDVYEAVLSDFYSRLPQIISTQFEQINSARRNEEDFYGAFPKLREHKTKVEGFAQAFRQVNPQMSREDFMKQVGLAMMASLGIPFDAAAPQPTAPAAAAPAAPGPAVVARDIVRPGGGFAPAPSGGVAPAAPAAPGSGNIWDQFAKDLEEDDS